MTSSPPGIDCTPTPEDPSGETIPGCTHDFPPNTDVELTAEGADFRKWVGGQNESFCVPETVRTCVIRVVDYTSWAGVVYDDEEPPQLAQTIQVRLQIKKGGGGTGTVTAPNINCARNVRRRSCTASSSRSQPPPPATLSSTAGMGCAPGRRRRADSP